METSFEFLKKIQWIIQPIADLISFFFIGSGVYWLITIFSLYIIFTLINAIRKRMLLVSSSKYTRNKVLFGEIPYIIISEVMNIFLKIITRLPVLLGIFLFFIFIGGVSKEIKKIVNFVDEQKYNKKAQSVLKQIDKRRKVAEIQITEKDYSTNLTTIKINFCDENGLALPNNIQIVEMKGNNFYFSADVLNFEYSVISDYKNHNLFSNYKIYSNEVSEEKGIKLNTEKDGLPYVYQLSRKIVLGMTYEEFETYAKDLIILKNKPKKSKAMGVEIEKVVINEKLGKGQIVYLWIEKNGKLSLERKYYSSSKKRKRNLKKPKNKNNNI
ncbi:MAG: hypothetical protein B6I24_03525 [Bacteroidetes bacterium 4572_128]|nr:MAG: hypothetical protein B6I24_03525 [Bacteroidetes bacterium 4572_128]